VDLEHTYIYGTKIEANANRYLGMEKILYKESWKSF